jgi:hypothetical protein
MGRLGYCRFCRTINARPIACFRGFYDYLHILPIDVMRLYNEARLKRGGRLHGPASIHGDVLHLHNMYRQGGICSSRVEVWYVRSEMHFSCSLLPSTPGGVYLSGSGLEADFSKHTRVQRIIVFIIRWTSLLIIIVLTNNSA